MDLLAPSAHDLAVYARVSLYVLVATAALRALGRAFGPLVARLSPRAYDVLRLGGLGLLSLLNDAAGLLALVRGAPPDAAPPPLALVRKSPLDFKSRPAIPPPAPTEPDPHA